MQVRLSFGRGGLAVNLPSGFDYKVLECPPTPATLPDAATRQIEAALDQPTAGPALAELAAGKRSAAISVCDITRPAPNPITLPPLLRRLEAAGVPRENTRILIATGLHRPATEAEICHIVGQDVASQYQQFSITMRATPGSIAIWERVGAEPRCGSTGASRAPISTLTLGFIEPHLMLGFSEG